MHTDDIDPNDALALDPDWADVPPELAQLDGKTVTTVSPDDGTEETAFLLVVPGLFGHARRLREGVQ